MPLDSDLWYVFVPEAAVVILCGVAGPVVLFKLFKRFKATRFCSGCSGQWFASGRVIHIVVE